MYLGRKIEETKMRMSIWEAEEGEGENKSKTCHFLPPALSHGTSPLFLFSILILLSFYFVAKPPHPHTLT